jgi:hypothetical protein
MICVAVFFFSNLAPKFTSSISGADQTSDQFFDSILIPKKMICSTKKKQNKRKKNVFEEKIEN